VRIFWKNSCALTRVLVLLGQSRIASYKAVFQMFYNKDILLLYSERKANICYIRQEKGSRKKILFWMFSSVPLFSILGGWSSGTGPMVP
jgi:hypothetical protein